MGGGILTFLIFVPAAAAAAVGLLPRGATRSIRAVATAALGLSLAAVAAVFAAFHYGRPGLQLTVRVPWIPAWHVQYFLGVDGLSLAMLALSAVVGLLAAVASYGIESRAKEYYVWYLIMQTGIFGVFCAQDLILFLFFFDIVLVPMYFLIAIWGGPRREYAAIKFLIYTFAGSTLMLVAVLALFFLTGGVTFAMPALAALGGRLGHGVQVLIFLGIFVGLAIKLPVVPLHTWLPDAHVEAPTPVSVQLAAVLLKIGGYGILRVAEPLLPAAAHLLAPVLAVLGVVNIIYGALAAMAQHDFKKLVAYSSVSHMGYVLLGVAAATPLGIDGAIFQMVSHGLISAMLFLLVGVFYDRCHTREFARLGGMYRSLPLAGTILGFAGMANLGLPTLSGFVAEFFTLLGTFGVYRSLVFLAVVGVVLTAGFNLIMLQRVLTGPPRPEWSALPAVSAREMLTLFPLVAGCVLLGIAPATLMHVINPSAAQLVARLGG